MYYIIYGYVLYFISHTQSINKTNKKNPMIQTQYKNSQSTPTIKMTTSSITPSTQQFTTTPIKQSNPNPNHNSNLPNNNSKIYSNVQTNSKSIYRGGYSYQTNTYNNNSFSQSDIMSMMTRKSNYAIQSVPHSIVHAKLPSRDYFASGDVVEEIQEDVAEEGVGERKLNGFVSKSNFGNSNIYARQKTQLANVLATILSNKLKQHFTNLKQSINISQTTKKTPTFNFNQNQSSSIRQSQTPASHIQPLLQLQQSNPEQQLIQRLVGKISRQSLNEKSRQTLLSSPKSKKSRTASKMLFSQYSQNGQTHRLQTENLGYVPLVNKLVFVGGLELVEEHARVVNMNGQVGLMSSKKL